MVDIHSHILPCLDDGAETLEETLAMLQVAADNGTTDIVSTPDRTVTATLRGGGEQVIYAGGEFQIRGKGFAKSDPPRVRIGDVVVEQRQIELHMQRLLEELP